MISKLPPKSVATYRKDRYLLEALPCKTYSPWKSHPNKYWKQDAQHFIDLAVKANAKKADLVLVNYATRDNVKCQNEIKLIFIKSISKSGGIVIQKEKVLTRREFDQWFKEIKATSVIV